MIIGRLEAVVTLGGIRGRGADTSIGVAYAGDNPNITVGSDGHGKASFTTDRVSLTAGGTSLFDADGSSLVLGPNSQVTLESLGAGGAGSNTVIKLLKGLLNAMVEKLSADAVFEVQTANAVAAVKGTDFEVAVGSDDTAVTVSEGTVQLGDAGRRRFEPVGPLQRRRFALNRMLAAETLSRRDASAFGERWQRARMFHQQRHELLKNLRAQNVKEHRKFIKELKKRRENREALRESWKDKREEKRKKRKR